MHRTKQHHILGWLTLVICKRAVLMFQYRSTMQFFCFVKSSRGRKFTSDFVYRANDASMTSSLYVLMWCNFLLMLTVFFFFIDATSTCIIDICKPNKI